MEEPVPADADVYQVSVALGKGVAVNEVAD
jgi:hypothetical protein